MLPKGSAPFLVFISLALSACGSEGIPHEPLGTPPPPPTRPSDGVLGDPELQRVVDLQVNRDGPALMALLGTESAAVRARAAFALGSVQYAPAGRTLAGLLRDPDPAVRRDAAFALGQLFDPLYGPVLLGALRDESVIEVRGRLLEALGKVGEEREMEGLLEVEVGPEEEGYRNLAIARIGTRGVALPAGIGHLVSAVRSGGGEARTNAGYYFGRYPSSGPWAERAGELRAALDSLPASDPLAMHLISGLSLVGAPEDTPRFRWWLANSPDWRIRVNAAGAVGGRTAQLPVRQDLMRSLDDPSTHVGLTAAEGLFNARQLAQGEADDLMEWVRAHPEEWRRAGPLLAVLGRLGEGEFLVDWIEGWADEDVVPRTRGLGAIAFAPGDEATQVLLDASRSEHARVRGTALGGLARRWQVDRQNPSKAPSYFQAFAAGVRSGDPAAVFVAAPPLADSIFLSLGSVGVLVEAFRSSRLPEDLEGMQAILGALGQAGTPESEAFLEEALTAPHPALRATAAEILGTLRGVEIPVESEEDLPGRQIDWAALARLGPRPLLVLETEKGTVRVVLDAESAPLTVQTVAGLAEEGRFDGTPFHRVVPNFVVQGGDVSRADGFGGPGFTIRSEFTEIPFRRGVIGMASAGKDTEGSQFFVTHSMQPHLDGGYTAFGWVAEGMDVVDQLFEDDRIVAARVEPNGS